MTTDNRPILFLDVDGVLNCFDAPARGVELRSRSGLTYVPPRTRERVAALLEHFEPVWATAWLGRAHGHHREHLALPAESWPYIDYHGCKLPMIVRYACDRRWAWVDDEAGREQERLGIAWGAFWNSPSSLVLEPDAHYGLTDEHVERLIAFAEGA